MTRQMPYEPLPASVLFAPFLLRLHCDLEVIALYVDQRDGFEKLLNLRGNSLLPHHSLVSEVVLNTLG